MNPDNAGFRLSPTTMDPAADLAAEQLAQYVARVVAAAPPLSPAQRDRVAALLRAGGQA